MQIFYSKQIRIKNIDTNNTEKGTISSKRNHSTDFISYPIRGQIF